MFHIPYLTDFSLLFLRAMVGLIYADSGYEDLKDPDGRGKSLGTSKPLTLFIGIAELAGAAAIVFGVLQQLAAIGLVLIMLGAIQKKAFVWKTGFWGKDGLGWYYDATLIATLFVIFATDGGNWVILR